MKCRKVQAVLSEYLEGDLRARQADPVREHLAACADCKRELVRLRSALGSLARTGALARPAPDLGDLHRRIAAAEARRLAPRWRWTYALAPAASLLVALTVWLSTSGSPLELSPDTVAYTWAMPGDVPWHTQPPVVEHPQPMAGEPVAAPAVRRTTVTRRVRTAALARPTPKPEVSLTVRDVARPGSYKVSLSRPDGGIVTMSSRPGWMAGGEPAKVYINYEGPAGNAGPETTDESSTTL